MVLADNSRYGRRKEQETADNAKMLQAEPNDQGADNTTSVYLEGFTNGINCYGNPLLICGSWFGATAHDDAHDAFMALPAYTSTKEYYLSDRLSEARTQSVAGRNKIVLH